uniref:Replication factor A C-terminal domain-containing protein n=1 Tax=Hucho hucho TaxID=62062 RepID=A0A4W5LGT1_9TELE
MSVRRALVDCAVLSLQDSCVFYPCCRGCFSRMQQTDTARWHCSRSCYSCLEPHLDYRYRLSLRVTRDNTIFGVTVFGSCLNLLFGAPATDLHRLVEESSGPMGGEGQRSRCQSRLLVKAVEDCFIGRHFVFGIKISGPHPYSRAAGQFIASQISLPLASSPGCSVVSYYRALLQQAALCADWTTDPRPASKSLLQQASVWTTDPRPASKSLLQQASVWTTDPRPASKSLLQQASVWTTDPRPAPQPSADTSTSPLLLHPSPLRSFNSTLPSCGRSITLTPTPTNIHTAPWQQSPGVITSSAEQEEEEEEEEGGRENKGLSHGEGGGSDSPVHPPASLTWTAPTQPGHIRTAPSSLGKRGVSDTEEEYRSLCEQTCRSDFVAWEDMPFSECLGECVCHPADTETRTPTDHQAQTSPLGRNLSTTQTDTESSPTSHRTLLDITNVGQPTHGGLSPRSPGHNADLEEQYNCSADLFHCSQTSTDSHTAHRDSHTAHRDSHTAHRDSHTAHRDSHTAHRDSHTAHRDSHTAHRDSHTPHRDSHTPHRDSHTPHRDSHTPHRDSHTPHTDSHTTHRDSHMDTPSECCDCVPLSQSTPIIRKTAPPRTLQIRAQRHTPSNTPTHTPEGLTHTKRPRPRQPEPRDHVLALQCQRLTRRALKTTPGGRRTGSVRVCDDNSEMGISPTERPWCSRRTDRQQAGGERVIRGRSTVGERENRGRTTVGERENRGRTPGGERENRGRTPGGERENRGRTPGGERENRGRTPGGERENRGRTTGGESENRRSTHIDQTLREGQTEGLANQQLEDSMSVSPSLHEENEACDWSRDLFTESF